MSTTTRRGGPKIQIQGKAAPRVFDPSDRLGRVQVLVADRDARMASLTTSVLRSFGFIHIELATDLEKAISALTRKPFGLIITEWVLATSDGINLVREVRAPGSKMVRRDIPIIMLTARSDVDAVKRARDAGITEFLAKPFSAQTMSHRLIQVIDNPRNFVEAPGYIGPCRRRRGEPPPGEAERRGRKSLETGPNRELAEILGDISAAELFTEELVREAQQKLQQQESVFIEWANDDILQLENSFKALQKNREDSAAHEVMLRAAYSIKAQAGMFGYDLGTQIGGNLVDYLEKHPQLTADNLTVLRKHIDTMAVIFHQKIKQAGREIGAELLTSLQKLVEKLG